MGQFEVAPLCGPLFPRVPPQGEVYPYLWAELQCWEPAWDANEPCAFGSGGNFQIYVLGTVCLKDLRVKVWKLWGGRVEKVSQVPGGIKWLCEEYGGHLGGWDSQKMEGLG